MSPLAMLLTGFVIGGYSLKTLASDKKVYLASVIRLIILPSVFMAVLLLLKTDKDIIRVALCATAMPLGLNTVVFPAAYGGDTTPGYKTYFLWLMAGDHQGFNRSSDPDHEWIEKK